MTVDQKVRENRMRRVAARRGYELRKSRLRDPLAVGFGTFTLVDREGVVIDGLSLDEVEAQIV